MGAVARLVEFELGPARDHFLAEGDEDAEELLEVHQLRPAVIECQHVAAEALLERRETVELVQHHFRDRVAAQLDDDPHAVAIGFVAQIGNALDSFLAHQFRDLLDHRGLVDLIGDLGDDQGVTVLADLLDLDPAPHDDRTAPQMIG